MSNGQQQAAATQPAQFVEIGDELAKEKGIANGGWVRVDSKRGFVRAKAVVTKRIKPLMCDGKQVHIVGIPIHWGFMGAAKKGFGANTLTPFVGDANIAFQRVGDLYASDGAGRASTNRKADFGMVHLESGGFSSRKPSVPAPTDDSHAGANQA